MDSAAEYSTVRPAALGPLGMGTSQHSALEEAFGAVLPPHVCEAEALLDTGMETMEVMCVYCVALDFFSSSTFVLREGGYLFHVLVQFYCLLVECRKCGRGGEKGGGSACSLRLSPYAIPSILTAYSISFNKTKTWCKTTQYFVHFSC